MTMAPTQASGPMSVTPSGPTSTVPSVPRTLTAPTTQPSSPLTTPLALAGTTLISESKSAPTRTPPASSAAAGPTAQHALTQLASMSQGVEVPAHAPGVPQTTMVGMPPGGPPPGAVMVRTQYGVQMIHGQRPGRHQGKSDETAGARAGAGSVLFCSFCQC